MPNINPKDGFLKKQNRESTYQQGLYRQFSGGHVKERRLKKKGYECIQRYVYMQYCAYHPKFVIYKQCGYKRIV